MTDVPEFRIGFVLGGAVSAGAYTAGAMDFLIEALDAWDAHRDPDNPDLPRHWVRIDVMTGASAGSMCAGIAAVALGRKRPDSSNESFDGNPFYEAWVKGVDIGHLLDPADLESSAGPLRSLLNSARLKSVVAGVIATGGPEVRRDWVNDPLIIRLAQTNLRGVPYTIDMRSNTGGGHSVRNHADETTFILSDKPIPVESIAYGRTDWKQISRINSATDQGWVNLGDAARASGAFPAFLESVVLARAHHAEFDGRLFDIPGDNSDSTAHGKSRQIPISPSWPETPPRDPYRYLCVDSGAFNNEPLQYAREVLAEKPFARNPRDGDKADRAVVLIDPFVGAGKLGPDSEVDWFRTLLPLGGAMMAENRYNADDLALAQHETVYSRFLLAPSRGADEQAVEHPCAGGGLGGFSGFFHQDYRHHDYMLGRRNCQKFLMEHFSLPRRNKLFEGWSAAGDNAQGTWLIEDHETGPHLPIIPLFGKCAEEICLPDWPVDSFDPASIDRAIARRVDGIYTHHLKAQKWYIRAYVWAGWRIAGRGKLLDLIRGEIRRCLVAQRLWTGQVPSRPDPAPYPDPRDMH